MKATGIVRRIDDLGRVVIPKEIRRTMRIREGDPPLITLTPFEKRATISCRMLPRPSSPPLAASVSGTTPISESTIKRFSAVCGFRAS